MSHLSPGLLSAYNSLTDKHLAGYFSNTRIRRHLQRAGLISRSGRIVPDKEYRHKLMQRTHQRHVRECLAQAIFHKVLEMERLHQIEIKRKLEEFARRERVHKIKLERSRRYEEDIIRILSPRPPTGVRGFRKQHSGPEGEQSESSESLGSTRPNTAPGKMQRPVRLKPIHSNGTTASLRRSSPFRLLDSSNENEQLFNSTVDKESRRRVTTRESSNGVSPYCLPVINNFVTPVPPVTKRKERGVKVTTSGTLRGRRLRPTTATSGADISEDPRLLRSSVHQSRVAVNMVYFGKAVHLSHDLMDLRDEVKVFQQHCGGENLCVFKGKLHEGESFQLLSRRHRGFPFSLTFYLNGLQVERLSSCCEFKHRKGPRLGGRHGHFGFVGVDGASPCYKCIIAMGLDKKPTPPPKRVKEAESEESVTNPKNEPERAAERTEEDTSSHSDGERSSRRVQEEKTTQQSTVRNDYDEDFEADDEGPAEEEPDKKVLSASSETEMEVKERETSESEDDENKDDIKSYSSSSSPDSDREVSDAEDTKESREDEKTEEPVDKTTQRKQDDEEDVAPNEEKDESNPDKEAATAAEAESKGSDLKDGAAGGSALDIADALGVPSGQEETRSEEGSGEKEAERRGVEEKQEEEEEEKAESVQEMIRETRTNDLQQEATDNTGQQDNEDATVEKSATLDEQLQSLAEEMKKEESVDAGEAEAPRDLEDAAEPKEVYGADGEPGENIDGPEGEAIKTEETAEEPAPEEEADVKDTSEGTDTAPQTVSEADMMAENLTLEPHADAGARSTDPATDGEHEDKTVDAGETDAPPQVTDRDKQDSEVGESSVSELDEKTGEEAEVTTVSQTAEMKAESSEEREALTREEAPAGDTRETQQRDGVDASAASQTGGAAEDSSSSLEGSGETMVENTTDTREEDVKEEGGQGAVREDEPAEMSADGDQRQGIEEELTEKSEINVEMKKEMTAEENKEEEKTRDQDETVQGENSSVKENNEEDVQEENESSKSMTGIKNKSEENEVEETECDEKQASEEAVEKPLEEMDEGVLDEKTSESEKTEGGQDGDAVGNQNKEEESGATEGRDDQTNKGEEINDPELSPINEKELDEAKPQEQEDKESEGKNITPRKSEEGTEASEKPEKATDNPTEDTTEPEVAGQSEAGEEIKMADNVVESARTNSENGEIDAENGEMSTRGERKGHDGEMEASDEGKKDEKTIEHVEDNGKTEEGTTEEKGEEVEENTEGDAEGDVGKQSSEQEVTGTELKAENKTDTDGEQSEETKQVENFDNENRDSNSTKNNDATSDVITDSSAPTDLGLGPPAPKLDDSTVISNQPSNINPITEDGNQSAPDGDNGEDKEEASKASAEGASVLLKPQAANNDADSAEQSFMETPAVLTREDNTDLVTNWITMHQRSKFFETFVEPLEDFRDDTSNAEETTSTELQRLESPPKMASMSTNENSQIQNEESEDGEKNKAAARESDVESKQSGDKLCENDLNEDGKSEAKDCSDKEASERQRNGSQESLEGDKMDDKRNMVQGETTHTEVESISGSHHSVNRGEQGDEETLGHAPDSTEKPAESEGAQSLRPVSKTEDRTERSASPGGLKDTNEPWEKVEEQRSGEVTEITDFTTSRSDAGSQRESQNGGIRPKASDGSVSGELIHDVKPMLSKDRLSSFSVDEAVFGHSSYPLLTAARTESSH